MRKLYFRETIWPAHGITKSTSSIRFELEAQKGKTVWSLQDILLNAHIRLARRDGTPLINPKKVIDENNREKEVQVEVGPQNNFLLSCFRAVKIYFNGTLVCNLNQNILYQYLMLKLNSDISAVNSYLATQLYVEDTRGSFEKLATNAGFKERYTFHYLSHYRTLPIT